MPHYWWQGGETPGQLRHKDIHLPDDAKAKGMTMCLCDHWEQDVRCWRGADRPFTQEPLFVATWDGHEAQAER